MARPYSRASTLFFDVPLVLLPSKAEEIRAFWESKFAGATIDFEDRSEPFAVTHVPIEAAAVSTETDIDELMEEPAPTSKRRGKVAILPLHGVMSQRMNLMSAMSGGTSTEAVAAAFREQVEDPDVRAIVFDIDSPGGSSYGVTELANVIMDARGRKPLLGVANSIAASGAYWIGAALDRLYASPGALVGSIGVFMMHQDLSQMAENEGVRVTLISAGKNKTRGNEFEPLDEGDRAHFQSLVDDTYDMFVRDVARGRRVSQADVRNGYGQGDIVTAKQALKLGMIDGIQTLEATVASALSIRPSKVAPTGQRAEAEAAEEVPSVPDISEGSKLLAELRWRELQSRATLVGAPGGN